MRATQNAVADGTRQGTIRLNLNATSAQTQTYELGDEAAITASVIDDDIAGIVLSTLANSSVVAVAGNTNNTQLTLAVPVSRLQLAEGDSASLRFGTTTSPFANVTFHVNASMITQDNDGVIVQVFSSADDTLDSPLSNFTHIVPGGVEA